MKVFDRFLLKLYRKGKGLDETERYDSYRKKYDLDPSFRFNGPEIVLYGDGKIHIGAHSYIGRNSYLAAVEGASISIGSHCAISHYFTVYTTNLVADQDLSTPRESRLTKKGSVKIGDYCWIGYRVFIREGVNIGNNVVIGAHSVVINDLEDGGVYGGAPARLIRKKR